jgi:hypothetical protein
LPQGGRWAGRWWRFDRLIRKTGQHWFGRALIWQEHQFPAWVSAAWEEGYREPWFLLSDRPAGTRRLREDAKRMRVEAPFEDTKRRGWELESTVIRERGRLERWLLVLFLALWWLAHLAAACLRQGKRDRFDRHDRRDKGIFRLGRLWFAEILRTTPLNVLSRCLPFTRSVAGWRLTLRF